MFRCTGVEVIRKNVSCAFTASQVCVTVVGFGFTLRQTSSLYGYGNREKRPTVARGPGEYSSMATSVILESTWCNYPVAGTQRSRPLPSSTLEPKAPLFIAKWISGFILEECSLWLEIRASVRPSVRASVRLSTFSEFLLLSCAKALQCP